MTTKAHRIGLAAVLATAALAGTVALSSTVHLGADAAKPRPVGKQEVVRRTKALKANAAKLDAAVRAKPPKLSERPHFDPLPAPVAPPVVVTRVVSTGRSTASAKPTA